MATVACRLVGGRQRRSALRSALAVFGIIISSGSARADSVQYIYDDLGRLTEAADTTTGSATLYGYDAAGNITSIATSPLSSLAISNLSPASGPAGTLVTLSGTGFSTTAGNNIVTFGGGAQGAVQNSPAPSATQLVVSVPGNAQTGPVSVAVSGKSITSATPYTVTAASFAPTITSIAPTQGSAGTSVQISGSNFQSVAGDNKVAFNNGLANVTAASSTALTVSVPASATSGPLQVTTANGSATSTQIFIVPPVLPSSVPNYPISGGATALTLNAAQGPTEPIVAGAYSLMTFNGTVGQPLALGVSGLTGSGCSVIVLAPNGTPLLIKGSSGSAAYSATVTANGQGVQLPKLPASGTYSVLVTSTSTQSGSAQFTLAGPTPGTTLSGGGTALTVNLATPGQRGLVYFQGSAGGYVKVTASNSSVASATLSILAPDGSAVLSRAIAAGTGTVATVQPQLPLSGQYSVLIEPNGAVGGSITLTMNTGTALSLIAGTTTTINFTTVSPNSTQTFADEAGDYPAITFTSNAAATATLIGPDGAALVSGFQIPAGTVAMNPLNPAPLPLSGIYTLQISEVTPASASMNVMLAMAADSYPSVPSSNISAATSVTSQWLDVRFSGLQGQYLAVYLSCANSGSYEVVAPDGTLITSGSTTAGGAVINVMPSTQNPSPLQEAGPYALLFQQTKAFGTVTLSLSAAATSFPGTLPINGSSVSVQTTQAAQWMQLGFVNPATQSLTLSVSGNSSAPAATVWVLAPNGAIVKTASLAANGRVSISLPNLAASASPYTVLAQPSGPSTGLFTFTLTQP